MKVPERDINVWLRQMEENDAEGILPIEPITTFSVVSLSHQDYAEIDPKFTKEFTTSLGELWYVKNERGSPHELIFNVGYDFPLIIGGWNEMKEYYRFPADVEVKFSYFGENVFAIKSIMAIDRKNEILNFHSRCEFGTPWFHVPLTRENVLKKKLTIPSVLLAQFIRKHRFSELVCCTDDGKTYPLRVILLHDPYKTKLGYTWFQICESNHFKGGDVVRFKFDSELRCHLYKVGEY